MGLEFILIFIVFLVTCLIGIPVGFSIGFTTWISFLMLDGKMMVLAQKMFTAVNSFNYLSIPLFLFAAEIMSGGKLINRIVGFFDVAVGHIRGGLAYVNVLTSMVFAGISGSSSADMASLGAIQVEMMDEAGYDRTYATAVSASSACIAPIIPPSGTMILYVATAGGVSISQMFAGGYIPGMMFGGSLLVICAYYAKKYNHPKSERASLKTVAKEFVNALPVLFLPAIIFGTVVFGICTAIESGAIAVFYAMSFCLITRRISFKEIMLSTISVGKLTASVTFIVATATALSWVITILQIPQQLTEFCLTYITSPVMFLMFVNVLLLFTGCVLDGTPAILLMVPILHPVALSYGIDEIHFGIVTIMNLSLGLITPPIGMMLFVGANVTGTPLSKLYKAVWPFVLAGLVTLLLVTYIPALSTFLPSLM